MRRTLLATGALGLLLACHGPRTSPPPVAALGARRLGYTIQAGAFSKVEHAARLAERLRESGLEATYFVAADGLFKVRFGDFPTRELARRRAETLKMQGTIETYYLVRPELRPQAPLGPGEQSALRKGLVRTAESYLGIPYLWGGASVETGFDCSGLAMSVYRMNGLELPRSSRDQFQAGTPVDRAELRMGDLVFFATGVAGRVNHVGIYIGQGQFIHAPRTGQSIRRESLTNPILARQYVGARTYL
nr:NlpC/P60 family protein [uncultured Holophaga sp.]